MHPRRGKRSRGVTLNWQPSTDDRGLRHYEACEGGTLVAATTATRYSYGQRKLTWQTPVPPPAPSELVQVVP